jgi:acetyl esterase/lipase
MPMPLPLPGAPQIPLAVSIAPADTADTTVLDPRPEEQASLGAVALREHADIVYHTFRAADGGGRELKLDILRPATAERLPLLVYLPGGGFIFASKENAPVLRSLLAESGFVVASIEYRTVSDQATYVDSVHDTRQAVAYLRAHADDYGIDPRAAGLWGESAGGYVAAMTGVTNDTDRFSPPGPAGRVDAVVDSFGPSDLSATGLDFDEGFQSFYRDQPTQYSAYLGAPGRLLSEIPEAVQAADPASYASVTAPPFLLLHGTDDMLVSPSQTQHLHQALLAAGADSTRYLLAGANHGDLTFLGFPSAGRPWLSTTALGIATDFLHRHLDRP